jgi:hypothetical protein
MDGEKNLLQLLKTMQPKLNDGEYVFCVVKDLTMIDMNAVVMHFKEAEAFTIIIKRELADQYKLDYSFVAAWITLKVHSSLEAVGLTAAFSAALSSEGISCNVVAAFYHDHIFVDKKDAAKAMLILSHFSA